MWAQAWSCRLNALSSDATPGHREPCAETNARVGIKFAAQNVIDVSTVVALSYILRSHTYCFMLSPILSDYKLVKTGFNLFCNEEFWATPVIIGVVR